MSELTKLIGRVDLLQKDVAVIKANLSNNVAENDPSLLQATFNKLNKYSDELVGLTQSYSKFESKLGAVDPVSGEKRYGAATEAKILAVAPVLTSLRSDVDELLSNYFPLLAKLASPPPKVEEALVVEVDQEAEAARLMELEKQRLEKEAEEQELNRKAQLIRDRKAQEQHLLESYNKEIEDKLTAIKVYANSSGLDSADILACIQSFGNSAVDQKKSIIDMLETVSSILEAIISRPDNLALRKLRLTHPTLKVKIVEVYSGIELLLSLGFHMTISTVPSSTSPLVAPGNATVDKILQHVSSSCPIESYRDILHLLTPTTRWDCFMEMEEPAVSVSTTTVTGKDDWIVWFDKLSADRELVTNTLKSLA